MKGTNVAECPVCDRRFRYSPPKHCPVCGSKLQPTSINDIITAKMLDGNSVFDLQADGYARSSIFKAQRRLRQSAEIVTA
jgi:predicted amidophosphoribosyltransferase